MKVGYVRCSTIEQNEARQLKMMEEHNIEKSMTFQIERKNCVICVIEKQTRAAGSALVLFLQFSILLRYIRWVDHSGEEVVLTLFSNPTDIISLTKQHVIIHFLEGETDGAQGGNHLTTLRDHIQVEIKCGVYRKIPLKIPFFRNFSYL